MAIRKLELAQSKLDEVRQTIKEILAKNKLSAADSQAGNLTVYNYDSSSMAAMLARELRTNFFRKGISNEGIVMGVRVLVSPTGNNSTIQMMSY